VPDFPDIVPILPLLADHEIGLLVAHGSRVSGRARPASDLDLGAERRDGRRFDHRALAALQLGLSRWAGLEVDLRDLAEADAIFRFELAGNAHVLYESESGRFKAFVARTLIDHDDIAPFLPMLIAGVGRAARQGRR